MHGFFHTCSRNDNCHNSITLSSTLKLVRHFDSKSFLVFRKGKRKGKKKYIYIFYMYLAWNKAQHGPVAYNRKIFPSHQNIQGVGKADLR